NHKGKEQYRSVGITSKDMYHEEKKSRSYNNAKGAGVEKLPLQCEQSLQDQEAFPQMGIG
ncbi:hypothetical protein GBA52_015241, partial [Prunus armeniaca]